ncbi:hypothetical protein niasHS_004673 [Heterodera schachtii]|uniref:MATH domain-containing protein n=1 Tax=Heterodera schachtii TaxID=97005 RepID=A0ABD2JSC0_HETSC
MEIEKVSEFAVEEVYSRRFSDAVDIGGMPWKILAQIKTKNENNKKWLGFYLCYDGPKKENLSCKSSATLRIVSQKNGTEDLIGKFNDHIFKDLNGFGFPNSISFAELLDPSKGFYNKDEDKVKLAIDVFVDEPKTEQFISDPNKSNGTLSMEIEELSEFVREIKGSERKSETLYIKGMPWKILVNIETKNENNKKWLGFSFGAMLLKKMEIGAANVRQHFELFLKRAVWRILRKNSIEQPFLTMKRRIRVLQISFLLR